MKNLNFSIIVISSIMALTLITNHAYGQTQLHDNLVAFVTIQNSGETSTNVYFLPGEQINFVGTVEDSTKFGSVGRATVDLTLTCPNDTITKIASVTSDNRGGYSIMMPVTSGFAIGDYVVNVSAHKEGYTNDSNTGAAFFLVARGEKQIIKAEGQDFPVYLESIELQTDNLTFNKDTKSLNFDLKEIAGDYAPKGISWINGIPWKNQIFVTFKKPLISAPFHVYVNGQDADMQVSENQTHYFLDIALLNTDSSGEGKAAVVGTYAIPEFPLAVPVLLASITSSIIFYRMRNIQKT
jgi:hypothetical protein